MFRTIAILFAGAVSLLAVKPAAPKPEVAVPSAFHNQPGGAVSGVPEQWWKGFGDPLLDDLIARAETANLDVRKAGARLAEADASRIGSRAALLPNIDSTTSVSTLRGGFNQGVIKVPNAPGAVQSGSVVTPFETSILSSGFSMRWEADVFGGLRKSLKAASADAQAAEANIRDVLVIVRAEVARNFIEVRGAEDQMAIVRANIESEKDLLDLIRARAEAGLASELDVERQIVQLSSVTASLPDLDARRLQGIHRIGVLLGEEPGALIDRLRDSGRLPQVPVIPAALPGELLKRRPDVRRAEAQINAAYMRAGAARADLYPKFVITGLSGRQSTDLSGLTLGAGNFFSVGPGISLPILNFGRIRSQIAVRDAQLEQALRSYESEVLAALEETENAFVARDRAGQRHGNLEIGVTAAKRSVEMARELYLRGLADFLTVLDAQRQQFQMERELSASNEAVLRSTVAIYKALP
jgi:NodT family efflux transporter outer membrane factor (OMF) lipoprotein